jgi:hypothetical protein
MRVIAKIGILLVVLGGIGYVSIRVMEQAASAPARHEDSFFAGSSTALPAEAAGQPGAVLNATAARGPREEARSSWREYPFPNGEKLEFTAGWATLVVAGKGELRVASTPSEQNASYHFVATAETVAPTSYLFLLQDRFDSYAEAKSLASLRFEMQLREGKSERTGRFEFDHKRGEVRTDDRVVPIKSGIHDTVALIYAVRATDWEKKDAAAFDFFDGKQTQQLRVRVVSRSDEVVVAAGKFAAIRAEMQVWQQDQPVNDQKLVAWLSGDRRRLPLKVEAQLPFGVIRVELVRAQP